MAKSYRYDVQILRAIAVLLVFFSHAGVNLLANGYIGVDVFFVISGFVITRILIAEYDDVGKVDLIRFYARRMLRLLPAFVAMLLIVNIAFYWISAPDEYLRQLDESAHANLWLSNLYFATWEVGYFDQSIEGHLFIHTWSLSVEEQFYLIWPLALLALLSKYKRGHQLVKLSFGVTAIMCAYAIVNQYLSPNIAFYSPLTRVWQFSVGACVALMAQSAIEGIALERIVNKKRLILSGYILSLILIIVSASVYVPKSTNYTLVPSLATAAAIFFGQFLPSKVFQENRVLRFTLFIGAISYSFYLWHWPVIIGAKRLDQLFGLELNVFVLLLATFAIASISYLILETRLRALKFELKSYKYVLLSFAVVTCLAQGLIYASKSSYAKHNADEMNEVSSLKGDLPELYQYPCDSWYQSVDLAPCIFGDKNAEKSLLMFGDSVLAQWFPAVASYYVEQGWSVTVLTKSSCALPNRSYYYARIAQHFKVCDIWKENVFNYVAETKPTIILVGGDTSYELTEEAWLGGLEDSLEFLSEHSEKVKIISDNPALSFNGIRCVARLKRFKDAVASVPLFEGLLGGACSDPARNPKPNQYFAEAAAQFQNVEFYDVQNIVCPNQQCSAMRDNLYVYRDSFHLSASYTESVSDEFLELIESNLNP